MTDKSQISIRALSIKPSLTLEIGAKAKALKAEGKNICSLSAGEPDFDTPEFIVDATLKALKDGKTRYGPAAGDPELREAIAQKQSDINKVPTKTDNVLVTNGGKQAIYNLFQVVLNPGDEVLIPTPYWLSYPEITLLAGAKPIKIKSSTKDKFKIDINSLEEHVTEKTRLLIINSPSNPTGCVLTEQEMKTISDFLRRHPRILLMSDEIYEFLISPNQVHHSFAKIAPDLKNRIFTVNGFAKAWAMTGWRIGYLTGNAEVIKKAIALQSQSTSNVCSFAQKGAIAALQGSKDCVHEMANIYNKRRLLITERLKKIKNKKINKEKIWKLLKNDLNEDTYEKKMELLFAENKKEGVRELCELCSSKLMLSEEKFLICSNDKCGIIYKDCLDSSAEWRFYGASDNKMSDPTRCGMPINPLLRESSYACRILLNYRSSYQMKRIKRYTDWQSMPYKEKTRYDEFQRIKIMSKNSGIPKIMVDEALRQHKKISEMKTFRGCNRDGIIAASVYIACRVHNFPRTAKEIATIFHLDNSSSTKGCKNAMHLINNMEQEMAGNNKTKLCKTNPTSFIERYCSRLSLNKEITKVCLFVALNIQTHNIIPENTPHSVAAGIVYFVSQSCNLNISKKDVSRISEISEVTINKCYKKLDSFKDQLIPSCVLVKYVK